MNLRRRIIYGLSGNVLTQTSNILIQFVGIPVFIANWGLEYYGEWILVFTIPSYIALSDFGMGVAAAAEMSMKRESGDVREVQKVLKSAFWSVALVGAVPCVLLALLMPILPLYDLLGIHVLERSEFDYMFLTLLVAVYVTLLLTIPLGYYRVEKEYHRERIISLVFRLLEFGGIMAAVISGFGVMAVATVYLFCRIVYALFVLTDQVRRYEMFRLMPVHIDIKKIKHLIPPSLAVMKIFAGQTIQVQGTTTIIGLALGPVQLVIFNTIRTLLNTSKQLVNLVNSTMLSEFSYAFGAKRNVLLNKLFVRCQQANVALSFGLLFTLLLLGEFILDLWTNGEVHMIQPFYTLLLGATFINSFWNGPLTLLSATNRNVAAGWMYLIASILALFAIGIFIEAGGLTLVGIMLLLFELTMAALIIRQSMSIVDWRLRDLVLFRIKTGEV